MHYLSHLHLDLVTDCNHTLTLHLPALTYLGANLSLVKQTFPRRQVFPFDLEIPNVKTINLSGAIAGFYTPLLQHQINSWRESVVEMVLCSDLVESDPFLPLDQLSGFPQLTTLGLSVDGISSSTADIFAVTPLPASSPLSLVLFGLEKEIEHRDLDYCKEKLSNLFINGEQPWFSKLIVGSGWRQLAEKSYTDCEAKRGDNQETEDALSSYWPVLEYLDQKGISIEDRNGVKYRKEMGQSLQTPGIPGKVNKAVVVITMA
ncbi:hypothetical protein FRC17_006617 [Serendipita sp. 399]|nr:hypothetical protein FRC17_006617 [Serendipita sp. 399]